MELLEAIWADPAVRRNLIATGVLLAVVALGRVAGQRAARSFTAGSRDVLQLRWTGYVRRIGWLALVFGLLVIWSTELQAFALSIVAFAVAIVLATKELILCVSGSILRTSARSFSIGDRIEVAGVRGDVIDHGLLTTTILEIGVNHARTGRAVSLPNSALLSNGVINETFTDDYVLHTITVPFLRTGPWQRAEQVLLEAGEEFSKVHQKKAKVHLDAAASAHGLSAVSAEPRVSVVLRSPTELDLLLRVPTPARDKGRTEQEIVRRFLLAELS